MSTTNVGENESLSALTTPKRRTDVNEYIMDGEAVILDKRTDAMHLLNETALLVWKHCDGAMSKQSIAQELSTAFSVDQETANAHVSNVLQQLADSDLLAHETVA